MEKLVGGAARPSPSRPGGPLLATADVVVVAVVLALAVVFTGAMMPDPAYAKTDVHSVEGGVEIEISYPDGLVAGRDGIVSILVKNNGWEDKQGISFALSLSDDRAITAEPDDILEIGRLAEGGSYGKSVNLHVADDAGPGTHYLNLRYTHVLVANNETAQEPFFYDVAVPVNIKGDASVNIRTYVPESIFGNAEFPITVEMSSEDMDLRDVRLRIVPPSDIEFRGETLHAFSKIERGTTASITARLVTPVGEVPTEYKLPFEIIVEYVDDVGEEKTDAQTISVTLRPRAFMELTSDGGIWIGGFFIAPYVSIGTIVGIPAGAIISILLKRRFGGDGRRGKGR